MPFPFRKRPSPPAIAIVEVPASSSPPSVVSSPLPRLIVEPSSDGESVGDPNEDQDINSTICALSSSPPNSTTSPVDRSTPIHVAYPSGKSRSHSYSPTASNTTPPSPTTLEFSGVPSGSSGVASGNVSKGSGNNSTTKEPWFLRLPKARKRGRSLDIPKMCIHCVLLEEQAQAQAELDQYKEPTTSSTSTSTSEDERDKEEEKDNPSPPTPAPTPTASAAPVAPSPMFLQVPMMLCPPGSGKPRSSSLDDNIYRNGGDRRSSLDVMSSQPDKPRATSVDVTLPTAETKSYGLRTQRRGTKASL